MQKIFISGNVKITNAQKAFEVNGLENSLIGNFNFNQFISNGGCFR
jgi:hypothetical protein